MNPRDIWTYYSTEVRAAFRERSIVINSILIPLLLYPVMIWLTLMGLTLVTSQNERFVSKIELAGLPAEHEGLRRLFEEHEKIELVTDSAPETEASKLIRRGELDAYLEFHASDPIPSPSGIGDATSETNFVVSLYADSSKERSTIARSRAEDLLTRYRNRWLDRQAELRGIETRDWQVFELRDENVASEAQMGNFLLGLMLPIMFVVMVAIGSFYPAVDATAGERERNTWETTFSMATSRTNIVVAKYLVVTTFGCIAGFLNVAAMTLSMRSLISGLLGAGDSPLRFSIEAGAFPILLLAAVLLAGFIGAGMMIFAGFARTFREGQSMVTPFYLVVLLPTFVLNDPGLEFTSRLALTPVVNVALVLRDAFRGVFEWHLIALTTLSSLVAIALLLMLARRILDFEDIVTGSYSGNLGKFLKSRLLRRTSPS